MFICDVLCCVILGTANFTYYCPAVLRGLGDPPCGVRPSDRISVRYLPPDWWINPLFPVCVLPIKNAVYE